MLLGLLLILLSIPLRLSLMLLFASPKLPLELVVVPFVETLLGSVLTPFAVPTPPGAPGDVTNVSTGGVVLGALGLGGVVAAEFEDTFPAGLPLPEPSSAVHKFSKLRVAPCEVRI